MTSGARSYLVRNRCISKQLCADNKVGFHCRGLDEKI
jgi:hypothetical protein